MCYGCKHCHFNYKFTFLYNSICDVSDTYENISDGKFYFTFLFFLFCFILIRGKRSVTSLKFSCSRPELYEIVSNVSRAVSGKTSLAVLEGILIRAKSGVLSFR